MDARKDDGISTVSGLDLWAIRTSLEAAGIRFEVDDQGQPSAALVKAQP